MGAAKRQSIEQDSVRVPRRAARPHHRRPCRCSSWRIATRPTGDALAVQAQSLGSPRRRWSRRYGSRDLGGALLYGLDDIRERRSGASARETAAKVACGAVAKGLLAELGCTVASHVVSIGAVSAAKGMSLADVEGRVEPGPLRRRRRRSPHDGGHRRGPRGGGHARRRGRSARLRVPARHRHLRAGRPAPAGPDSPGPCFLRPVIGVDFGLGFEAASLPGSSVHDPIVHDAELGYGRESNRAGGIEGGISTGDTIVPKAAMKPISTLREPFGKRPDGHPSTGGSRASSAPTCAPSRRSESCLSGCGAGAADAALEDSAARPWPTWSRPPTASAAASGALSWLCRTGACGRARPCSTRAGLG